jgi:hypothetical protein
VAALTATPWRAADAAREKIAVLGIETRDEGDARSQQRTAALARALTEGMRQRADMPGTGYEIAPNSSKELLELKLLSDCIDEAPECMAAIGRDLGADVVLFGNIEHKKDGAYAIWVRSLSVASKKAGPHSLVKTIPGNEVSEEAMRKLAVQLFPETARTPLRDTTLVVETNVIAGTILVNGVARGSVTPKRATVIRGLAPGQAKITIEASGYVGPATMVTIREGEPARATVTLEEARAGVSPPLDPIPAEAPEAEAPGKTARVLFWTSLVATGAGVAAFTITGLQVRSIEDEQDAALAMFDYQKNGVEFPDDACAEAESDGYAALTSICDRGRRMATITNVLIGVTAAAAVATAIFYWKGYLAPGGGSSEQAALRKKKKASKMVWAPEIYQSGAGLGAVIQF